MDHDFLSAEGNEGNPFLEFLFFNVAGYWGYTQILDEVLMKYTQRAQDYRRPLSSCPQEVAPRTRRDDQNAAGRTLYPSAH